jgi:hypothetical protein
MDDQTISDRARGTASCLSPEQALAQVLGQAVRTTISESSVAI